MVLHQILESVRPLFSPPHGGLMVRSAILWGLGGVAAQAITHYSVSDRHRAEESEEFEIDWIRVYNTSSFGLSACIGPAAYYRFIDMYGLQPKLVASTVLEGFFGTLDIATFFPFMGFFGALSRGLWHGSSNWSVKQAKEDLKRGFTPALVMGGVMVPAMLITFSRFIPVPYQLHCASSFALVGSCSLSWIELQKHKDEAAGPEDGRSDDV